MRRLAGNRDDSGVATIFVVVAMPVLILFAALVLDGGRAYIAKRETQNSADAAALAMATDCANGLPTCVSGADATAGNYSRSRAQRSSITDENVVAGYPQTYCDTAARLCTATMQQSIGFHFASGGGNITRSGTARWGTLASATTLPITIASCEFTTSILDGTANIYLYVDQPSPGSGCSGGPGGFGSLTDTGSDTDCLTVSVVNNVAVGGTGASDHAQQCFRERYETVLNGGGFVDVFVPIYGPYSHVGNTYNYTIVGYAAFRLRGYEFNGAPGDAGTLNGGGANCPNIGPGNEYCLHGDFVRFVTSGGILGPSNDFGTFRVYLSI